MLAIAWGPLIQIAVLMPYDNCKYTAGRANFAKKLKTNLEIVSANENILTYSHLGRCNEFGDLRGYCKFKPRDKRKLF